MVSAVVSLLVPLVLGEVPGVPENGVTPHRWAPNPALLAVCLSSAPTASRAPRTRIGPSCPIRSWIVWRSPKLAVVPRQTPPSPEEVMDTARGYLGVPYSWGGTTADGFDCSGLVNKVFARVGYDLPRVSGEIFRVGVIVDRPGLIAGDLIFFSAQPGRPRVSHVGIYIGDDAFIHASTGKGEVTFDHLTSSYFSQRFLGGRRIIGLPPGRYSSPSGAARPRLLFSSLAEGRRQSRAVLSAVPENDEIGQLIAQLTEHGSEQRPPQLAPRFSEAGAPHVGPRLIHDDQTGVGLRVGGGRLRDGGAFLVVPEGTYFGHANTARVALAAPLLIPVNTGESVPGSIADQWDEPRDWTKIVQRAAYGQPGAELQLDLSRTVSATLGQGTLIRNLTPNLADRFLPQYVVAPNDLSLSLQSDLNQFQGELFIDDVLNPMTMGARAALRPLRLTSGAGAILDSTTVGLSYIVDRAAPNQPRPTGGYSHEVVSGIGLDLSLQPLATSQLAWTVFAALSGLQHSDELGLGGTLGSTCRVYPFGSSMYSLQLKLEGRLSQSDHLPSYFDLTYNIDRQRVLRDGASQDPQPKLAFLESLRGTSPRWSAYGEVSWTTMRRFKVGLAYEDGNTLDNEPLPDRFRPRNLTLFFDLRRLYLPGTRRAVHLYLAYHLRYFRSLTPVLTQHRDNEYLFVAGSVQVWRYLSIGGTAQKSLRDVTGESDWAGVLELRFAREL